MRAPRRVGFIGLVVALLALTVPVATSAGAATPGPVGNLTLVAGNGFLTAHWTAPTDTGGGPVFAYSVVAIEPGGGLGGWTNLLADSTSASVDNLTNGVTYTVHVITWTAGGTSGASTTGTPTAAGPAPTPPPQVQSLEVTYEGPSVGPTARWTAPPSDGGSPIVAYSMVVGYGRPPFVSYQWVSVGPHDRVATCSGCPVAILWVFAWNARGPGEPWVVGQWPF